MKDANAPVSTRPPAAAADGDGGHRMQCMEIWGGNAAIMDAVSSPGLDAWVYSRPHEGAKLGGDIHYVSMCASGRIARYFVADVSGHGEAVSELAGRLRTLMRKNINTVDQTKFARALNEEFMAASDSGRFATAVLATYWAPTRNLILCNAGHPRPMWYRAATREWSVLDHGADGTVERAVNLPLGVIEPTDYHQFAIELNPGDLVVFITDGLVEAKDDAGRMLGERGLLEIVRQFDPSKPTELLPGMLDRVVAHQNGRPIDDDVTVVLLHHNGAPVPVYSIGEYAGAVAKMLGLKRV